MSRTFLRRRMVWLAGVLALGAAFGVWQWTTRHTQRGSGQTTVAQGVLYRYIPEGDILVQGTRSDALILDVDLRTPGLRVEAAAEHAARQPNGAVFADAHTVREWCQQTHAIGGINGGFFGKTQGETKEVMGLLLTGGQVLSPGRKVRSPSNPSNQFVRCALGFTASGTPRIGWLTSDRDNGVHSVNRPLNPTSNQLWNLRSAVSCGPRLIADGQLMVTDHEERLVSPRALPRTFVAYDMEGKGRARRPRHLLLGIAMEMTFADVAAFTQRYFRTMHHTECADALCLDGGSSSQLVYRDPAHAANPDAYIETRPSFVTLPTALLIRQQKP